MSSSLSKSVRSSGGLVVRAFLQTMTFILMARLLAPEEYGAVAALTAIALMISQLGCMGYDFILVREAAHCRAALPVLARKCLRLFVAVMVPLLLISVAGAWFLLPKTVHIALIALTITSEFINAKINHLAICIATAENILSKINSFRLLPPALRFVAIVGIALVTNHIDILQWVLVLLLTSLMASGITIIRLRKYFVSDLPRAGEYSCPEWSAAYPYAIGNLATRVKADIDKLFLSRMTGFEITGNYSIASRAVDILLLPSQGFITSHYLQIYRCLDQGVPAAGRLLHMARLPLLYSLLAALLIAVLSERLFDWLLPQYHLSGEMLRYLAFYPLVNFVRNYSSTVLIGITDPAHFLRINVLVASSSVVLNYVLIARYGWLGGIVTLYLTDMLFIAFSWFRISRFDRHGDTE